MSLNKKLSEMTMPQKLLLSFVLVLFFVVSAIVIMNLWLSVHLMFWFAIALITLGGILGVLERTSAAEETAKRTYIKKERSRSERLIGVAFLLGYLFVMFVLACLGYFGKEMSSTFAFSVFIDALILLNFIRATWW